MDWMGRINFRLERWGVITGPSLMRKQVPKPKMKLRWRKNRIGSSTGAPTATDTVATQTASSHASASACAAPPDGPAAGAAQYAECAHASNASASASAAPQNEHRQPSTLSAFELPAFDGRGGTTVSAHTAAAAHAVPESRCYSAGRKPHVGHLPYAQPQSQTVPEVGLGHEAAGHARVHRDAACIPLERFDEPMPCRGSRSESSRSFYDL